MSEERILEFLDGRLGGQAEEELLHTLAVSPERRQMLRDHLRLRELTSHLSRQEKFAVPEHVSQQLFTKLSALGYAAPPTTAAILTRAADFVKHEQPAPERSAPVYWTGRRMAGTLAVASVVSFLLGVSAFYVFGERLGLHTLSDTRSASIVSIPHLTGPVHHQQYASAAVDLHASSAVSMRSAAKQPVVASFEPIASRDMSAGLNLTPAPASVMKESKPVQPEMPIIFTAPIRPGEHYSYQPSGVSSKYLYNPGLNFDPFNPLPFLSEKGTISFRFGTGRLPIKNQTPEWTSLSELKFTWALGKLVTARASLGQLMTYEREANTPMLVGPKQFEITTTPQMKVIPVAGLEMGLALDQYGLPVEISAGALADGAVKFYPRAALFGHYDILPSLNLGVGIEGIVYDHDISRSVTDMKKTFKDDRPFVAPNTPASEKAGFLGLAFELGWHF